MILRNRTSKGRALVATLIGLFAIAGCHKIVGGGWMAGLYGGKATFGFQAQCVRQDLGDGELNWLHEGQFQFQDRSAGVRFHGDISAFIASNPPADTCKEDVEASGDPLIEGLFRGQCVSRPGGFVGSFSVQIIDNGTPGSLDDDFIEVHTPSITDIFNPDAVPCTDTGLPYVNRDFIGGGNISSIGH